MRGYDARGHTRGWRVAVGLLVVGLLVGVTGCNDDEDCICCRPDTEPPAAPRGFTSVTGDRQVTLSWLGNTEADLDGYFVYYTDDPSATYYDPLATIYAESGEEWVDFLHTGLTNSVTYYYAISAFDRDGNESDITYEIEDTPRPEGHAMRVDNSIVSPSTGGFDFRLQTVVPASDLSADFFFEYADDGSGALLLTGYLGGTGAETRVQDMGWTADLDEIDYAPDAYSGWSPTGIVEVIEGHTYVFYVGEGLSNYYAKIRVTEVGTQGQYMTFGWAFQAMPGNRQLSLPERS